MDCTTLLLIDDHPLFRKGLAQLFGASDDFEVVGQAASGREGINLAGAWHRSRSCWICTCLA